MLRNDKKCYSKRNPLRSEPAQPIRSAAASVRQYREAGAVRLLDSRSRPRVQETSAPDAAALQSQRPRSAATALQNGKILAFRQSGVMGADRSGNRWGGLGVPKHVRGDGRHLADRDEL